MALRPNLLVTVYTNTLYLSTYLLIYISTSTYLTIYRSLRYSPSVSGLLAKLLLVSGQTGVLLYTVGSGLRCHLQVRIYSIQSTQSIFTLTTMQSLESQLELASHLATSLQTLLQTLFLADAAHR